MELETRNTIIQIVLIFIGVILFAAGSHWLSWYTVLGSAGGSCIIYFTIMCTKCQRKITNIDKILRVKLEQVKVLENMCSGKFNMITTPELVEIESKVEKQVWVATFDLSYDLKYFVDIGKRNLERRVVYKYYIPKECEADFDELKSILQKLGIKPDAFKYQKVIYVDAALIPFNVVLYDPLTIKCGYIYSPQENTNQFIQFDEKSFRQVRNYFKYLEKHRIKE